MFSPMMMGRLLGEDVVAQELAREVRILCMILTSPANHQNRARHIKATWAKRCNYYLFMSTANGKLKIIQKFDLCFTIKNLRKFLFCRHCPASCKFGHP